MALDQRGVDWLQQVGVDVVSLLIDFLQYGQDLLVVVQIDDQSLGGVAMGAGEPVAGGAGLDGGRVPGRLPGRGVDPGLSLVFLFGAGLRQPGLRASLQEQKQNEK